MCALAKTRVIGDGRGFDVGALNNIRLRNGEESVFDVTSDALQVLIGRSTAMLQVRERIQRIARSPVPVLILGETGTGKDLCAEALGRLSGRTPFVPVNCAAIPEGVAESELFGNDRGAFTGAVQARLGVVAIAHGGTLFLDELGELPTAVQAKLLRTLESGEYRPLGSTKTLRSDFRILAATSSDVERAIAGGRMRADLLHRLGAVRIVLPPLRARREDIPLLAQALLRNYLQRSNMGPSGIAQDASVLLMQHDWPGNIRQLRNVIEAAAAIACGEDEVQLPHVLQFLTPEESDALPPDQVPTLGQVRRRAEGKAILDALSRTGGNRERAAKLLRISAATLYRKLAQSERT